MPLRYLVVSLLGVASLLVLVLTGTPPFAGPPDGAIRTQIQLNQSPAARQLAEQSPRSLLFNDRMGTAQVAYLSEPLTTAAVNTPSVYRAGDVAYWALEKSIVVFLAGGTDVPTGDLALIGRISVGLDDLAGCARNCPVLLDASGDGPVDPDAIER